MPLTPHALSGKELARLRKGKKSLLWWAVCAAAVLFLFLLLWLSFNKTSPTGVTGYEAAREELLSSGLEYTARFIQHSDQKRQWLQRRGLSTERRIFEKASVFAFSNFDSNQNRRGSFISGIKTFFFSAFLRVLFVIVACWRFWLIVSIIACLAGVFAIKPHVGNDFLGQTGTGKLFYSGLYSSLEKVTDSGEPQLQVRGLACPEYASAAKVKTSKLGRILEKYKVVNETTLFLAGVVIAHQDWPAYVALSGEQGLLEERFSGAALLDNTVDLIDKVLGLHEFYRNQGSDVAVDPNIELDLIADNRGEQEMSDPDLLPVHQDQNARIDRDAYTALVQQALHNVLSADMRAEIADVDRREIVALVLAFEAAKAMAYGYEGGRWIRKTSFPQLTARAVLHSAPSFSKEYDYNSRSIIRQSLIYASRTSVYGPVRFPVRLLPVTRALRQWTEILMAVPHKLRAVADEVELYGIASEINQLWSKELLKFIRRIEQECPGQALASPMSGHFFLPLSVTVGIFRRIVPKERRHRLRTLVARVSEKQRQKIIAGEINGDAGECVIPPYEKILLPFSEEELKTLSEEHGLKNKDLREWASYRAVLNTYSWLARKTGQASVPDSSIIFAVFNSANRAEQNQLGLVSRSGLVPFRASRLEEKLGPSWSAGFVEIKNYTVTDSKSDCERALKGLPLGEDNDENSSSTIA